MSFYCRRRRRLKDTNSPTYEDPDKITFSLSDRCRAGFSQPVRVLPVVPNNRNTERFIIDENHTYDDPDTETNLKLSTILSGQDVHLCEGVTVPSASFELATAEESSPQVWHSIILLNTCINNYFYDNRITLKFCLLVMVTF